MHWGNVLLRPSANCSWLSFRLRGEEPYCPSPYSAQHLSYPPGEDLKVASGGVQVSLIDFTASRLVALDGQLAFCDLSLDPEVFEGPEGVVQV